MDDMKPATTANQQIQVITITSLEGLEPYAEQWDQLALQSPQKLPMLSAAWVMPYLKHCLAPNEKWNCYLAIAPDRRLVGVLPVVIKPHPVWRSFLPILHTPYDEHTRFGDLLAVNGIEASVLERFLFALADEFRNRFVLELKSLTDESQILTVLERKIPGWVFSINPERFGGSIKLDGSFADFQKKLNPKFRSNLHRLAKRLNDVSTVTVSFSGDPPSALYHFKKFLDLEASGWKAKSGTAIALTPYLKAFYIQLAQELAKRGWMELAFLEAGDKLIAVFFLVRFGSVLAIPKITYDEAYSRFSPGGILFELVVENAYAANCSKILLSNSNWLKNWRVETERYYEVWFVPKRFLPLFFGLLPKIMRGRLVRVQWIKSIYQNIRRVGGKLRLFALKSQTTSKA